MKPRARSNGTLLLGLTFVAIGTFVLWVELREPLGLMPDRAYPGLMGGLIVLSGLVATLDGVANVVRNRTVDNRDDRFPEQTHAEISKALAERERPFYVCTACKIVIPASATTGDCPRCDRMSDCHCIDNDEQASMVISLL